MKHAFLTILTSAITLVSCSKDVTIPDVQVVNLEIPRGFPTVELPENNKLTKAKIKLGKELFFDKLLSADNSISCSSCHSPALAFTDGLTTSIGVDNRAGLRNALPLFNLAWKRSFFRDGGVQILELVALNSINDHREFDINSNILLERLQSSLKYSTLFRNAFNDTITLNGALFALSSFQRTLISGKSDYDKYTFYGLKNALSEEQIRGKELFFSSKTDCSSCHGGFNFTNDSFQSNGYFTTYPDSGRQRITLNESDRGKFQTPSLRNVALTAPYMHNGSVATLDEIIDNYNNGNSSFVNKSPLIRSLGLTLQEKSDLLAFLNSLSDLEFIQNPDFKP
jgi:cytochrome c peroxidase